MKVKNIMFSGFAAAIFAGVCGAAEAAVTYELTSKSYVDTELAKKQDNLTAGTGIDITNNVVKSTLDLTPFATTTDMQAADSTLDGKITAEATARENADTAMAEDISENAQAIANEKSAREAADTAIRGEFAAADKALEEAYKAADTVIAADVAENAQAIADEAATRAQADAQIRTDFAAADSTLDGKITAMDAAYKTADAKVLEDAKKYTDDEITELNQSLSGTTTNLGALTERVTTAESEIDALQTADTTIRGEFAAADEALEEAYKAADTAIVADVAENAQAIANEKSAREAADTAIRGEFAEADTEVLNAINAENFVSANGILTTKGGYLVLSDGLGNVSLSQVAVVNGDGSKDMITGDSLN